MAPFLIRRSCGSVALAALELWGHRPHGSEVVGARAPTAPMAPTPLVIPVADRVVDRSLNVPCASV